MMTTYTEKLAEREERVRRDRPAGAVMTGVFLVSLFCYMEFAGLWWLAAAGAAAATGWTAFMIVTGIKETLPLPVPCELAQDYAKLQGEGWRKARVNPWWSCSEKLPHTHLVHTADHCEHVFIWRGRHVSA